MNCHHLNKSPLKLMVRLLSLILVVSTVAYAGKASGFLRRYLKQEEFLMRRCKQYKLNLKRQF